MIICVERQAKAASAADAYQAIRSLRHGQYQAVSGLAAQQRSAGPADTSVACKVTAAVSVHADPDTSVSASCAGWYGPSMLWGLETQQSAFGLRSVLSDLALSQGCALMKAG